MNYGILKFSTTSLSAEKIKSTFGEKITIRGGNKQYVCILNTTDLFDVTSTSTHPDRHILKLKEALGTKILSIRGDLNSVVFIWCQPEVDELNTFLLSSDSLNALVELEISFQYSSMDI
jgi:hypothetical protein